MPWFTATVVTSRSAKTVVYSISGATGAAMAIRMFSAAPATTIRKKTYGKGNPDRVMADSYR
jgi:hypothetical protein